MYLFAPWDPPRTKFSPQSNPWREWRWNWSICSPNWSQRASAEKPHTSSVIQAVGRMGAEWWRMAVQNHRSSQMIGVEMSYPFRSIGMAQTFVCSLRHCWPNYGERNGCWFESNPIALVAYPHISHPKTNRIRIRIPSQTKVSKAASTFLCLNVLKALPDYHSVQNQTVSPPKFQPPPPPSILMLPNKPMAEEWRGGKDDDRGGWRVRKDR